MPTSLVVHDTSTFPQLFGDSWWQPTLPPPARTGTGAIEIMETTGREPWIPTGSDLSTGGLSSWSNMVVLERALFLFASALTETTVAPLNDLRATFRAYLQADDLRNGLETGYRLDLRIEDPPRTARFVARPPLPDQSQTEATQLRNLTGLDVEELADIFGVSRPAYYAWMAGTPPRTSHHEHLLEVLALVEEAASRLKEPSATKTWLRTPIVPAGPTPLDLLHERDYDLFRGTLLRTRTGRELVRLLQQPKRRGRALPREDLEDGLERLRGRAWLDDYNSDLPER